MNLQVGYGPLQQRTLQTSTDHRPCQTNGGHLDLFSSWGFKALGLRGLGLMGFWKVGDVLVRFRVWERSHMWALVESLWKVLGQKRSNPPFKIYAS